MVASAWCNGPQGQVFLADSKPRWKLSRQGKLRRAQALPCSVLPGQQADAEGRELPSLCPQAASLARERRVMLSPTARVFKALAFSSQEKDTSVLEVFTVSCLSLAQDEYFPGLVWVLLPNPACPLQVPTLSSVASHLAYSTTAPVISHGA